MIAARRRSQQDGWKGNDFARTTAIESLADAPGDERHVRLRKANIPVLFVHLDEMSDPIREIVLLSRHPAANADNLQDSNVRSL